MALLSNPAVQAEGVVREISPGGFGLLRVHGGIAWHCSRQTSRPRWPIRSPVDPGVVGDDVGSPAGTTPTESMPVWLQYVMNVISPTRISWFRRTFLYRARISPIVWREILRWPLSRASISLLLRNAFAGSSSAASSCAGARPM